MVGPLVSLRPLLLEGKDILKCGRFCLGLPESALFHLLCVFILNKGH